MIQSASYDHDSAACRARARDRPVDVRPLLTYHKDMNSRYTCRFAVVTTWNEGPFSFLDLSASQSPANKSFLSIQARPIMKCDTHRFLYLTALNNYVHDYWHFRLESFNRGLSQFLWHSN